MRRVTLYTLNEQSVLAGDFVEMYKMNPPRESIHRVTNADELVMTTCERELLPVEIVTMIQNGDQAGFFFAVEPKLREILNAPFRESIRNAMYEADRARNEARKLQERIDGFLKLSWISRAWKAMRGQI